MKKLIYVALTGAMATSLVACKPQNKEKPIYNISIIGDYSNFEALEAEFERFKDIRDDVVLTYEPVSDYRNKLATMLEGDEKPNIFFSYSWMASDEKYNSVFSHMEDLSDQALNMNLDCIRPGLINRKDNKVLMAPIFSKTDGVLVNKNLFEKEGLQVPTTWSGLLEVCAAFREKGYENPMMGYSKNPSGNLMYNLAYPIFVAELAKDPEAIDRANNPDKVAGDPVAGEYMRSALNVVDQLIKQNCINIENCDKIEDNYNKVLLRFFDGDVPMMICGADTPSGTKKRESVSAAYQANPFSYSFYPIPVTEQGGYFIDSPSVQFSVNKDCDNLDVTNEFMRFLLSDTELNNMSSIKRLVTPTKNLFFDSIYAPFANVPIERTFSPDMLGVKDIISAQIRIASYKVGKGELTIDEAIAAYGTLK